MYSLKDGISKSKNEAKQFFKELIQLIYPCFITKILNIYPCFDTK